MGDDHSRHGIKQAIKVLFILINTLDEEAEHRHYIKQFAEDPKVYHRLMPQGWEMTIADMVSNKTSKFCLFLSIR